MRSNQIVLERSLWPVALVLALTGCEEGYEVSNDWSMVERWEIERAAERWNHVSKVKIVEGKGWKIQKGDVPGGWNGWTEEHVITVARERSDGATVEGVLMHEFGHYLGLRHLCRAKGSVGKTRWDIECTGEPWGVMDPRSKGVTLSEWDIAECRDNGVCF